ncbi:MAG: phosphatase PAP2 family protein [Planctomycetes bacterium]|nr:phosphatase PAP2 family protein [Planctomycetota bacterium]
MYSRRLAMACAWVVVCLGIGAGAPAVVYDGGADPVLAWNNVLLDAIKIQGGGPGPIARQGAMLHTAIYDAFNSIDGTHTPYLLKLDVPETTSYRAAIATAAHDVLAATFDVNGLPALGAMFDAKRDAELAQVSDGADKLAGIMLGQEVAAAILASRANDQSNLSNPYVGGSGPGQWEPTEMGPGGNAWGPEWYMVTPWAISSHDQFRPPAPPELTSQEYADAFNEVKEKGALVGSTRTDYETQTASFWANDRNGTWKPPGHLNYITQVISANAGLDVAENARLFALVNIAMGDASIVAWDAKFATDLDLWRPVTAIHDADIDGNDQTVADPAWQPLSADTTVNGFTPPFPAYTSGHATFAAAMAQVLADFFGSDVIDPFTIVSGDPGYSGDARTFTSLSEMALEDAQSRIYLGVHYQFDAQWGLLTGSAVGHFVFEHMMLSLRAVPEPTSAAAIIMAGLSWRGRRRAES